MTATMRSRIRTASRYAGDLPPLRSLSGDDLHHYILILVSIELQLRCPVARQQVLTRDKEGPRLCATRAFWRPSVQMAQCQVLKYRPRCRTIVFWTHISHAFAVEVSTCSQDQRNQPEPYQTLQTLQTKCICTGASTRTMLYHVMRCLSYLGTKSSLLVNCRYSGLRGE